ncbi:MAG: hypothetical protein MK052_02750 [Alphaproteobacteria bacterium]|nr:hypothetical protein [Alphaproteobacteria bacterium]
MAIKHNPDDQHQVLNSKPNKDSMTNMNPISMTPEEHIAHAQQRFDELGESPVPQIDVALIKGNLKLAGADASVLDPTGENDAEAMEKEIQARTEKAHLSIANQVFDELGESPVPQIDIARIKGNLKHAHVDASALDPTGEKDAEAMEEQIQARAEQAHLALAREKFEELPESYYPEYKTDLINYNLDHAGADASVLDPTGEKGAGEMRLEIAQKLRKVDIDDANLSLPNSEAAEFRMRGKEVADALGATSEVFEAGGADASPLFEEIGRKTDGGDWKIDSDKWSENIRAQAESTLSDTLEAHRSAPEAEQGQDAGLPQDGPPAYLQTLLEREDHRAAMLEAGTSATPDSAAGRGR